LPVHFAVASASQRRHLRNLTSSSAGTCFALRVGRQNTAAFEAPNIDGPSGSNQNGYIDVLANQMVAGGTWVLGPTRVLDARLGISYMEAGKRPPVIGGPTAFGCART